MSHTPIISKKWIQKHYIDKNWTRKMCADKRNVKESYIGDLIVKYELWKRQFKSHKVWVTSKMTTIQKQKAKASQPKRKEVVIFKDDIIVKVVGSITDASIFIKGFRTNVKKCLLPNPKRYKVNGFSFKLLNDYKPKSIANTVEELKENVVQEEYYNKLRMKLPKVYRNDNEY